MIKILTNPRKIPKFDIGQEVPTEDRQGIEYVIDQYGGAIPVYKLKQVEIEYTDITSLGEIIANKGL